MKFDKEKFDELTEKDQNLQLLKVQYVETITIIITVELSRVNISESLDWEYLRLYWHKLEQFNFCINLIKNYIFKIST